MSLRELQNEFATAVADLILFAQGEGFTLSLGECWRSPEECIRRGFADSLHGDRLAIDLNLFIDGEYQTTTAAHAPLGEYWKSLHELARWGGDFGDGNHYSFEYQGRK